MEKEKRIELYQKALSKWGEEAQVNMAYEEIGELLTALSRFKRGRANHNDIMTELADVSIMVEQIATLMNYDDFEKEKDFKLNRLKERLEKHGNNN
jgi:NTP pyrophosphatase (non-canonical NTP hydrolase)